MKKLSLGISGMANRLGADSLIVPYGYEKIWKLFYCVVNQVAFM
ncbi:hypothetical protein [Gilliamella sp. App4-10]|nr:hypothetical protein [Gilliamella apicola]